MSIMSTGSSALLAFQRALGTVSHNVANVNTEGYSRQRVDLESRPGVNTGAGYMGAGVAVQTLQRLADSLVFARQVDSSGEMGRLQQLGAYSDRVDGLLSSSTSGLGTPWSNFFGAAKGVVAEPGSSIARQALLDAGDQLAARFRSVDGQLDTIGRDADSRLASQVDAANQLAAEVARLNRDIVNAGSNANADLLDQRDVRITRLATLTGAQVVPQDDGSMNVFSGGQALVVGERAGKLTLAPDPVRSDRMQIAIDTSGGAVRLPAGTLSGEIGGLLEFRDRVLDPARAELGRMATAFAMEFNRAQRGGVDYAGNPGVEMFTLPPPRIDAAGANTGSATLAASVQDIGSLKGLDVELRFAAGSWSAVRPGSGEPVAISGAGSAASPLVVDGVAIVVGGTPAHGDRFALRPTADAAGGLRMALRDPNAIAAAAPLRAVAATANLGDAKPGAMQVTDAGLFAGFAGARIDFIDADSYTIDDGPTIPFVPGQPITGAGWSITLEGTPRPGDRFDLSRTPARSTDNGNARAFASLDERALLDGGTTGLTMAMSRMTARAGTEARHADMNLQAQQAIHDQVVAERDSVSGVNLDEEAADLMRYQQAYQAAAQVIATADSMFQTLLGAIRR